MSKKRLTLGLIFMDQDLNSGEPMTKRFRGSNDDVNGFLLLPDCYVREHPQICSVLTQNGFLIISSDQLQPFYKFAKNAAGLGLIKVYLYESSSASHDPLSLYVDFIHRETLSLLMKKNTYPKFMPEHFVRKCEICSAFDQVNLEVLAELLTLQVDVSYKGFARGGAGLFLFAAEEGLRLLIDVIRKRDASFINFRCFNGVTPLMVAAKFGHVSFASLLIEKGADVKLKSLKRTALHMAARGSHFEIVQLLLENGASPNGEADEYNTPLVEGIDSGSFKVVEILLKWGVNVNEINSQGKSALHVASSGNNPQIVEYLLKFGANVNYKEEASENPILIAAKWKRIENIKILLNFGADYRLKSRNGNTILHEAIVGHWWDPSIFEFLLKNCFLDLENFKNAAFIECEPAIYRYGIRPYWLSDNKWYMAEKMLARHTIQLEILRSCELSLKIKWSSSVIRDIDFEKYKRDCQDELAKLKRRKVGNSFVTLFDVLTKNIRQIARYSRNDSFTEYFNSNDLKYKFPIYGAFIDCQYRKGYFRKQLIDRGVLCLGKLSGSKISFLLSDLKEEVLEYLSNRDIMVLENVSST